MKFSVYTEIQYHGGKPERRLYEEVLEQIVHADRMGYDCYAIIEHFFFPRFSIAANPWLMWGKASERTERINFRTLGHPIPYINPTLLASQISQFELMVPDRYEFGVVRGHGWLPPKAGVPIRATRAIYEEGLEVLFKALESERFSHDGEHYKIDDSHIVPRPPEGRRFRVFLAGTSDRTYELAGERGWTVAVPPLLPYAALRDQLDVYRETCAKHGNEPDIVWIHACYIDEDRETARREAERGMRGFLVGNASPLLAGNELAPVEELEAAGFGFYASGIMEKLSEMPYDEMIEDDVVWVGTPQDIIERIEGVRDICDGLKEISITVNAGGSEHWKAIKAQELFADAVIPHFREPAAEPATAPLTAG
ncbi:MAG: LLM class flavin-dependent oxidoreductase [Solirubrobacterales bacterium]|nr:LLM class flavin-dependent oxidoreductase [Solirubrobacterales bacterium]